MNSSTDLDRFSTFSIASRILAVLLTVSPLAIGGMWMYRASAAAFTLQSDIRIAQVDRGRLIRLHLRKEYYVLAYAATQAPEFPERFERSRNNLNQTAKQLIADIRRIDPTYNAVPIHREVVLYTAWQRAVAEPIFSRQRSKYEMLLRVVDPQYSEEFLADDELVQRFLDDAAAASDLRRQNLLRHVLLISLVFVIFGCCILCTLLSLRQRAERRRLTLALQVEEEQRVSQMLQRSLTPDILPHLPHLNLSAVYVPAALEHYVGGDWFDAVELSGGRVMCIIGDVGGHGLDAAVIMNRARQSMLAAAITEEDPARVLERVNRALTQLEVRMVTAICCIIDIAAYTLTYSTAGHPPPIIVEPSCTPRGLANGGPPLGIFADLTYESVSCTLQKGSGIFLFTDGLVEEERDVIAGEQRVLAACASAVYENDAAASLYEQVLALRKPKDDVAILVIRLT